MGRDFTDDIDECCEAIVGHRNWAFAQTQSPGQMVEYRKTNAIAHTVIFFNDPAEDIYDDDDESN
jgi:hypothetical protein|tara:strand:- start:250 stop:444 length:195 start_codon:yes stop_codon:yes gene_type:complete